MTLVSGPVALVTPFGVERIDVRTTEEMAASIGWATDGCDALIMAAVAVVVFVGYQTMGTTVTTLLSSVDGKL